MRAEHNAREVLLVSGSTTVEVLTPAQALDLSTDLLLAYEKAMDWPTGRRNEREEETDGN